MAKVVVDIYDSEGNIVDQAPYGVNGITGVVTDNNRQKIYRTMGEDGKYAYTSDPYKANYASISLDADTGKIKIDASSSFLNTQMYKEKLKPVLETVSQNYKLNPEYKYALLNDEKDTKTSEDWIKEINKELPTWVDSSLSNQKVKDEVKKETGLDLTDEQLIKMSSVALEKQADGSVVQIKDDTIQSLPEVVKNLAAFKNLQGWQNGEVSYKDLMESWNREHTSDEDLLQVYDTVSDYFKKGEFDDADEYAEMVAFSQFIEGKHPETGFWRGAWDGISDTFYNIWAGTAKFDASILNAAEGLVDVVAPGEQNFMRDYLMPELEDQVDKFQTNSIRLNEAAGSVGAVAYELTPLAMQMALGFALGRAAANGVTSAAAKMLAKTGEAGLIGAAEGMTAEQVASAALNGTNFLMRIMSSNKANGLVAAAVGTLKAAQTATAVVSTTADLAAQIVVDVTIQDSKLARQLIDGNVDNEVKEYVLEQIALDAGGWAVAAGSVKAIQGIGKTDVGRVVNAAVVPRINKWSAKIGEYTDTIKTSILHSGDANWNQAKADRLRNRLEAEAPEGWKRTRLENKIGAAERRQRNLRIRRTERLARAKVGQLSGPYKDASSWTEVVQNANQIKRDSDTYFTAAHALADRVYKNDVAARASRIKTDVETLGKSLDDYTSQLTKVLRAEDKVALKRVGRAMDIGRGGVLSQISKESNEYVLGTYRAKLGESVEKVFKKEGKPTVGVRQEIDYYTAKAQAFREKYPELAEELDKLREIAKRVSASTEDARVFEGVLEQAELDGRRASEYFENGYIRTQRVQDWENYQKRGGELNINRIRDDEHLKWGFEGDEPREFQDITFVLFDDVNQVAKQSIRKDEIGYLRELGETVEVEVSGEEVRMAKTVNATKAKAVENIQNTTNKVVQKMDVTTFNQVFEYKEAKSAIMTSEANAVEQGARISRAEVKPPKVTRADRQAFVQGLDTQNLDDLILLDQTSPFAKAVETEEDFQEFLNTLDSKTKQYLLDIFDGQAGELFPRAMTKEEQLAQLPVFDEDSWVNATGKKVPAWAKKYVSKRLGVNPKYIQSYGKTYSNPDGYKLFGEEQLLPRKNAGTLEELMVLDQIRPGGNVDWYNGMIRSGQFGNNSAQEMMATIRQNFGDMGIDRGVADAMGVIDEDDFYQFMAESKIDESKILDLVERGNYELKEPTILYKGIGAEGNKVNRAGDLGWLKGKTYSDNSYQFVTLDERATSRYFGDGDKYILRYHLPEGQGLFYFDRIGRGAKDGGAFVLPPFEKARVVRAGGTSGTGAEYIDIFLPGTTPPKKLTGLLPSPDGQAIEDISQIDELKLAIDRIKSAPEQNQYTLENLNKLINNDQELLTNLKRQYVLNNKKILDDPKVTEVISKIKQEQAVFDAETLYAQNIRDLEKLKEDLNLPGMATDLNRQMDEIIDNIVATNAKSEATAKALSAMDDGDDIIEYATLKSLTDEDNLKATRKKLESVAEREYNKTITANNKTVRLSEADSKRVEDSLKKIQSDATPSVQRANDVFEARKHVNRIGGKAVPELDRATKMAELELEDAGYLMNDYTGRKWNDGLNVDVISAEGEYKYIIKTVKPAVLKDGKIVQKAQVVVGSEKPKLEKPTGEVIEKLSSSQIEKQAEQWAKQTADWYEERVNQRFGQVVNRLKQANSDILDYDDLFGKIEAINREITEAGKADDIVKTYDDMGREEYVRLSPTVANLITTMPTPLRRGMFGEIQAEFVKVFRMGTTGGLVPQSLIRQWFRDSGLSVVGGNVTRTMSEVEEQLTKVYGSTITEYYQQHMPDVWETLLGRAEETGESVERLVAQREMSRAKTYAPDQMQSSLYAFNRQARIARNPDGIYDKQVFDGVRGKLEKAAQKTEKLNNMRETNRRIWVYNNAYLDALNNGHSVPMARRYAEMIQAEATTNFSRQAYHLANLTNTVPYLGSAINGAKSFWRLMAMDPVGITTRIVGGYVVPLIALTNMSIADPENREIYKSIPEYEKDDNLVFVLSGQKISIPIPQEISSLIRPIQSWIESMQGANDHSLEELMANNLAGLFPYELQGFVNVDSDRILVNDDFEGVLQNHLLPGFSMLASQMMGPLVKSSVMWATGYDPYTRKRIDTAYTTTDPETGESVVIDYKAGELAKALGNIFKGNFNISADMAQAMFNNLLGTGNMNIIDGLSDIAASVPTDEGIGSGFTKAAQRLGEAATGPLYIPTYSEQSNQAWKRAVSQLYLEKDAILNDPEYKADIAALSKAETTEEAKNKALSRVKTKKEEFQEKVLRAAQNLVKNYDGGTIDRYKFASIISLMAFSNGYSNDPTEPLSKQQSKESYKLAKAKAIETMAKMGFDSPSDKSIFGYYSKDPNTGEIAVQFYSPLAILDFEESQKQQSEVALANIQAAVNDAGLWQAHDYIKKQRDAIYSKGKLSNQDYADIDAIYINWNAQVAKTLAPYVNRMTPEAAINNKAVRDYLYSLIEVPGDWEVNSKGRHVSLGDRGSKKAAYYESWIKSMFGINDPYKGQY